jgi:hypothetical protein
MKPPKEKFIGYTDKEWLEIKRVLARVGVDADTALVNQQPLRAELEQQRIHYGERANEKIPTTWQLHQVINEALAAIANFHAAFGPQAIATYYAGDELAAEAREALDRIKVKLQSAAVVEGRDAPTITQVGSDIVLEGGGPPSNARKEVQSRYWSSLARIWTAIVPAATSPPRQIEFLQACTGAREPAVRSYISRHLSDRPLQKRVRPRN